MIRATGSALAIATAVSLVSARALAHDESVSTSEIVVQGTRVSWTVDVGLAGLAKVVVLPGTPAGGELPGLTAEALEARGAEIAAYLSRQLTVRLDGQVVSAQPAAAVRPLTERLPGRDEPVITRVALELEYQAARPIDRVQARIAFFSDLTSSHRAVLRVRWGEERRQLTRLGISEVTFERGRVEPSAWRLATDFLGWGVHHILVGYDHIAFLLALLLAVSRLRQLVVIVTAFTAAHSLTILLAALELVRMPAAITEALIAASIVYVAAENLVVYSSGTLTGSRTSRAEAPAAKPPAPHAIDRAPRGRALLAFVFGLVHGLGFAEVLRDRLAEAPGSLVGLVLAFNLGVELGQLAIVALAFPLLVVLRRRWGDRRVLRTGSAVILAVGLVWLIGRLVP